MCVPAPQTSCAVGMHKTQAWLSSAAAKVGDLTDGMSQQRRCEWHTPKPTAHKLEHVPAPRASASQAVAPPAGVRAGSARTGRRPDAPPCPPHPARGRTCVRCVGPQLPHVDSHMQHADVCKVKGCLAAPGSGPISIASWTVQCDDVPWCVDVASQAVRVPRGDCRAVQGASGADSLLGMLAGRCHQCGPRCACWGQNVFSGPATSSQTIGPAAGGAA